MPADRIETDAIVLRRVDYAERDVIVHLLTREAGHASVFAKGARGSKRRFRGGLATFSILHADLVPRPDKLGRLYGSDVRSVPEGIGSDLHRMAAGAFALDVTDLALEPGQGAELYDRLAGFVRWLGAESGGPWRIAAGLLRYELVVLSHLGVLPDLTRTARRGRDVALVDEPLYVPMVGIIDPAERHPGEVTWPLTRGAAAWLATLIAGRFPSEDDPEARRLLRRAFDATWHHVLERDPKSRAFLATAFA